jgi:hypothetical protein
MPRQLLILGLLALIVSGCGGGVSPPKVLSLLRKEGLQPIRISSVKCEQAGESGSGRSLEDCKVEYETSVTSNRAGFEQPPDCVTEEAPESAEVRVEGGTRYELTTAAVRQGPPAECE